MVNTGFTQFLHDEVSVFEASSSRTINSKVLAISRLESTETTHELEPNQAKALIRISLPNSLTCFMQNFLDDKRAEPPLLPSFPLQRLSYPTCLLLHLFNDGRMGTSCPCLNIYG